MENIFIDTSIFEANNFLESERIRQILKLSEDQHIRIVLPEITLQEVISRATLRIKESVGAHKKFREQARWLRNVQSTKGRFEHLNEEQCVAEFLDTLNLSLEKAKYKRIVYPTVNIKDVFDKYFNNQFPFNKNDKKHEFPDAFALITVEQWCKENNTKCHVFAADGDLLQYINEHLIIVDDYKKFLDKKLRKIEIEKSRKQRLDKVGKLFDKQKNGLENEIMEWVYVQVGDESTFHSHLDIHGIEAVECTVSLRDLQIVSLTDDNINFESKAEILVKAEVEIDDENSGWYDDEEKTWHYMDTKTEIVEDNQIILVSFCALTPLAGEQYAEISITEINNGKN